MTNADGTPKIDPELRRAIGFLRRTLGSDTQTPEFVKSRAEQEGIRPNVLQAARIRIGVVAYGDRGKEYFWGLPQRQEPPAH